MGVDLGWLASRFDDLSKRYPRLSLITAMRPEELESVEYDQSDMGEGDWSHPSPVISGRYEPQYFSSMTETELVFPKRAPPLRKDDPPEKRPILISIGNAVSFPVWNFYGRDKGPWSLGIWSMWLHRELGQELANPADISSKNKVEHKSCLEDFAQILAIASAFVREHHYELGLPEWMKQGSGTNPSGMRSPFRGCCAWLLYLTFSCHFKEHSSFPEDKQKKPIELRLIRDIGLASVLLLHELERDRVAELAKVNAQVRAVKSAESTALRGEPPIPIKEGLDRSKREFVWNGKRFEWLTETMMDALEVLYKAQQEQRKVRSDEMENKIGNLPLGGFFKVFEVDRAGWEKVHPVRKVVGGRANSGWYLITPNTSQT